VTRHAPCQSQTALIALWSVYSAVRSGHEPRILRHPSQKRLLPLPVPCERRHFFQRSPLRAGLAPWAVWMLVTDIQTIDSGGWSSSVSILASSQGSPRDPRRPAFVFQKKAPIPSACFSVSQRPASARWYAPHDLSVDPRAPNPRQVAWRQPQPPAQQEDRPQTSLDRGRSSSSVGHAEASSPDQLPLPHQKTRRRRHEHARGPPFAHSPPIH